MPSTQSVLTFDGTESLVSLGIEPAFKVAKTSTLESWVQVSSQRKWAGIVSCVYDSGATESGYGMLLDGASGVFFALKPTAAGIQYLSSGADTVALDRWHHVAMTYDGHRLVIFIDGVEAESKELPSPEIDYDPENALHLGAYRDNDETHFFHGKIAEVRIWDIARQPADIVSTMNRRLNGDEAGLVGYWPLDEGEGDVAHDRSANAIHGTHTGTTWTPDELPLAVRSGTDKQRKAGKMKLPKQVAPLERPHLIQPHECVDVVNGRPDDLFAIRMDLIHGANYNDPPPFDYRRLRR